MVSKSQEPGRYFIISFAEESPPDEVVYFIQDNEISGIILFGDHCRDIDSLKSWLSDLKKTMGPLFLVAVDQEGGRVRRFTSGFPMLEAPRYYGHHNDLESYRSDLARVCEKLRDIGINWNLVPTVDLFDSGDKHVLDGRTFSDDITTVNTFAAAAIAVHHEQGLVTCAKHFPGLGRSTGDPHHMLAATDLDEREIFGHELEPFRGAIAGGVDAVMVTHLKIEKSGIASTLVSPQVISGWLKDKLEFSGPVVTDDLLMRGAEVIAPAETIGIAAFNAGSDLLLFGRNFKAARAAYDRLGEALAAEEVTRERAADAARRIELLKRRIVI